MFESDGVEHMAVESWVVFYEFEAVFDFGRADNHLPAGTLTTLFVHFVFKIAGLKVNSGFDL